jgi:hypothetical protein
MRAGFDTALYRTTLTAAVCLSFFSLACGVTRPDEMHASETGGKALAHLKMPEAGGDSVEEENGITLDTTGSSDGYVMMKCALSESSMKARIQLLDESYVYQLRTDETYEIYPLQMGDGAYSIQGLEQVEGDRYSRVFSREVQVRLSDPTVPFQYPNQYVSYAYGDKVIDKAWEVAPLETDQTKIARQLYRYVADNVAYDSEKAASVCKGYLPEPDETLESGKGICFDYAALLAAMLRIRGIPARLVIGYIEPDHQYHAWNEAYLNGKWILFDATLDGQEHSDSDYYRERIY